MDEFMARLGYHMKNPDLLKQALTHSSYANEKRSQGICSNERLEFLGDSVLGLVTAEYLFCRYPERSEGELTRMRASLVCEQSLYHIAVHLDLGKHLLLGHGEQLNGGGQRPSLLADAMEAVIAAVYLDGGFSEASSLIHRLILDLEPAEDVKDYKTELQELVQRHSGSIDSYELTDSRGPDHLKEFFVTVLINGRPAGSGSGHSKKEAEQAAARAAVEQLET